MKMIPSIKRKFTQYLLLITALLFIVSKNNFLFAQEGSPLEGRWDITIHTPGKDFPSWLEVMHSGVKTLVGRYVGIGGSAKVQFQKVNFVNNKMSFSIPPQWERSDNDISFEATFQNDSLIGTGISSDGKNFKWTAHRAPKLHRDKEPVWGEPIQHFSMEKI